MERKSTYLKEKNSNTPEKEINKDKIIELHNSLVNIFLENFGEENIEKKSFYDQEELFNYYQELNNLYFEILKNKDNFNNLGQKQGDIFLEALQVIYNNFNHRITLELEKEDSIESEKLYLKEYFNRLKNIKEEDGILLLNEYRNDKTDTRHPFFMITESDFFESFNYLIYQINLEKYSNQNLEDEIYLKIFSEILIENHKVFIYQILGNNKLSDEEKVLKIKKIFEENIEQNHFFLFRNEIEIILNEIFKNSCIATKLFDKLIRGNNGKINKNIRLTFIKSYPDLNYILDKIENESIGLGVRSNIELLKRIIKKIQNGETSYIEKYKFYMEKIKNKETSKKDDEEVKNKYLKEVSKLNLLENIVPHVKKEVYNKLDIEYNYEERLNNFLKLETKLNNLNNNGEEETKKKIKEKKEIIKKLKALQIGAQELTRIFNKGNLFLFINSKNTQLLKTLNQREKNNFFLLVMEKSSTFILNSFLNNNFINNNFNEEVFENYIMKSNCPQKMLLLAKNKYKDKKSVFLSLVIKRKLPFSKFINIFGDKFFEDFQMNLLDSQGNIEKDNMKIFISLYSIYNNNRTLLQGLSQINKFTSNFRKEGLTLIKEEKRIKIKQKDKIVFNFIINK